MNSIIEKTPTVSAVRENKELNKALNKQNNSTTKTVIPQSLHSVIYSIYLRLEDAA